MSNLRILRSNVAGSSSNTTHVVLVPGHEHVALLSPRLSPAAENDSRSLLLLLV